MAFMYALFNCNSVMENENGRPIGRWMDVLRDIMRSAGGGQGKCGGEAS